MLSLCGTLFLLFFILFGILVECSHGESLYVRKQNRDLVAKKRQNTLDLCQMFNVENEKTNEVTHNRVKRAVAALKPEERVEQLVDKLYDEPEDGVKVPYRKKNVTTTTTPEALKSGRRFDFAPGVLDVDIQGERKEGLRLEEGTVSVPWHKYWKHGIIPYFIDPNTYDSFLAEKITKAFDNFEQSTCIRLQRLREKPTDTESLKNVQWLYITNPTGTRQCVHSNEMKTNSGVQLVVFGYDCMNEGQIMHEIMHILGFSHEHVREDRDQYISVMWDNIKPGYKRFFETKQRPLLLSSLPYDYASVLHYPPRAFSKNGKYTLVAESGVEFGQREGLSQLDMEKVSMIFSGECIARNKNYLVATCPTVIASRENPKPQKATQQEIDEYFRDRIWPYGIVNFKVKDRIEFSIEERQNIDEVIKHIEKETCIEFRDMTDDDEDANTVPRNLEENEINHDEIEADDGNKLPVTKTPPQIQEKGKDSTGESDSEENDHLQDKDGKGHFFSNMTRRDDMTNNVSLNKTQSKEVKSKTKVDPGPKRIRRSVPPTPSRRHADDLLVLTRSSEPGCRCPKPGRASAKKVKDYGVFAGNVLITQHNFYRIEFAQELVISRDCFNSVNDLLHVFVHVLGLDHQHNSHDRDSFLAIKWRNISRVLRDEMQDKLPPAASVGFAYDYLSVMHYPWLDIREGVSSVMYPVWNDGWSMGHWQGLSSVDVQKLNLLYFAQCQSRKKHIQALRQRAKHYK